MVVIEKIPNCSTNFKNAFQACCVQALNCSSLLFQPQFFSRLNVVFCFLSYVFFFLAFRMPFITCALKLLKQKNVVNERVKMVTVTTAVVVAYMPLHSRIFFLLSRSVHGSCLAISFLCMHQRRNGITLSQHTCTSCLFFIYICIVYYNT